MNQHLNTMLEHLNLGSLRRNKNETPQCPANDGQIASSSESDQKTEGIVDTTVDTKSKNIFKNLINSNDNGKSNIFQNLMNPVIRKSSVNVVYKVINSPEIQNDDNNNFQTTTTTTIETPANGNGQVKRCSVVKSMHPNGDLKQRELSPSPRTHRKSSHDIRLRINQSILDPSDNREVVKVPAVIKPIKTKNLLNRHETFDTLHGGAIDVSTFNIYYHFIFYKKECI